MTQHLRKGWEARARRQEGAEERRQAREERGDRAQLTLIKKRRGESTKERARLKARLKKNKGKK